jgi:hypothetical protein
MLNAEFNVSDYYLKSRLQRVASMDTALDLAIFKIQQRQLEEAEDMLYNIVQDDSNMRSVYGLVLWEKGEYGPANALFYNLVQENTYDMFLNLILFVLYNKNGNESLSKKY